HGRLVEGKLVDVQEGAKPDAKIRLAASSDDLVALVDGQLNFARAWAAGQVTVKASVFDLMKLKSLL
ncbi:MAG: SCP2 sterol-binding domain-containing protein, partial [Micromonosporaceae bacterium]